MTIHNVSNAVLIGDSRIEKISFDLDEPQIAQLAGYEVALNNAWYASGLGEDIIINNGSGTQLSFDAYDMDTYDPAEQQPWEPALYFTTTGIEIKIDGTPRWTRILDGSGSWIAFGTEGTLATTRMYTYFVGQDSSPVEGVSFAGKGLTSGMIINSVPPPTSDIALSTSSVLEDQPTGTTVGTLTSQNGFPPHAYILLSGDDNNYFYIYGNTLRTNAVFNYEVKNSYSIEIQAYDGSTIFQKPFTISVTNVAEAPTDITLSNSTVAENAGANAVVGTLSGTGGVAPFTWSLVTGTGDTDNASFNISGNSLRANASFDYETKNSYSVRVQASSGGETFSKQMTITVTDVAEGVDLPATGEGSPVVTSGVAVGEVSVDPTVTSVTVNGNPLPTGSVLRDITTGQKFRKIDGDAKAFKAIPKTPDAGWDWEEAGETAWEILQDA